jgi:hypothetical protein
LWLLLSTASSASSSSSNSSSVSLVSARDSEPVSAARILLMASSYSFVFAAIVNISVPTLA